MVMINRGVEKESDTWQKQQQQVTESDHSRNCLKAFQDQDIEEAACLLPLVEKPNEIEKQSEKVSLLHLSSRNGWLKITKDLITNYHCNPKKEDQYGRICLHYAFGEHAADVLEYLVTNCNCDPMAINKNGNTVLHYAATNGSLNVIKYLIEHHHCNPMATNNQFETVLHCAVEHIDIVKFLSVECNCDPMALNDDNDTVLHVAASNGSIDVLKHLIENHHCNLMATNKQGETILHCAVEHIEVVKYLINECNYDPMVVDKKGQTPLHIAASWGYYAVAEYLLFTGKCDPLVKDSNGKTPLHIAIQRSESATISIFKKFGQIKISRSIDSYVNVLLLGNPGAGKSTLSHVITHTATGSIAFGSFRNVKGVEPCTAGIIPIILQHSTLGSIILHDFAGHPEYYSSHSAIIENLLQGTGGVFLIVVNILEKEAIKQLYQWLTIVRNEAQKALHQCSIIVVISHVDEVNDPAERRRKEELQKIIGRERYENIFLDCRKLGGSSIGSFFNKLSIACEATCNTQRRKSNLYHHEMYRLLQEERKKNVLTLSDIISAAQENDRYVLPEKTEEVSELLHSLASIGLINVLKSENKVWVVVNKGILLAEVNGILFAPKTFKEHVEIASNTGIVSVSDLARLFPHYDPDMLICFMKNMQLCQEINQSFLRVTNLHSLSTGKSNEIGKIEGKAELLFFPCLLYSNRPDEINSQVYQFGWCLQCTGAHNFFPPRYFHVLSLHLAYKFALPKRNDLLNRCCTFWRNGLHWFDGHGVGVLVEIVDESQCVLVLMSCEEGCSENMVCLRKKVIAELMGVYKESCPSLEVEEFLIDPKELSYPVKNPKERTLYSIKDVTSCILEKRGYLVNATGTSQRELKKILTDESLSDINNLSLLGGRDIKVIHFFILTLKCIYILIIGYCRM